MRSYLEAHNPQNHRVITLQEADLTKLRILKDLPQVVSSIFNVSPSWGGKGSDLIIIYCFVLNWVSQPPTSSSFFIFIFDFDLFRVIFYLME